MNKIDRMKELVNVLSNASYEYYALDKPTMTDREYDKLYDELKSLEEFTCCVLAGSPTQKVQGWVAKEFKSVKHVKEMLSANKTKLVPDVKEFVRGFDYYASYKEDGLTLVTIYKDGEFKQGITRGDGTIGEDVTDQCKFISNLPMKIPYSGELILRGECVISFDDFDEINSTLENKYSNPRNLAAGSLRCLDLNIVKNRKLSYIVFECVTDLGVDSKWDTLADLDFFGFETVERRIGNVEDLINEMSDLTNIKYPSDGLIFEINSRRKSESMGKNSHHENCRLAFKWSDEEYETKLLDIDYTIAKKGILTPTAVFEPVEIDGTVVERASLSNMSVLYNTLGVPYVGQTIYVAKRGMVIPKVERADKIYKTEETDEHGFDIQKWIPYPHECPICGKPTVIDNTGTSNFLACTNDFCQGKLLGRLETFVSKKGMDIDGMSEKTLDLLIGKGWISKLSDIYDLHKHKDEWISMKGFSEKSVMKNLSNIESSKNVVLDKFISAMSIPNVGSETAKLIAAYCDYDADKFWYYASIPDIFLGISGIGDETVRSIKEWRLNDPDDAELMIGHLMRFDKPDSNNSALANMIFCLTGKFESFSRDEMKALIEKNGGKVSSSVSSTTDYLVTNDKESGSKKNQQAMKFGTRIINEDEFKKLINNAD